MISPSKADMNIFQTSQVTLAFAYWVSHIWCAECYHSVYLALYPGVRSLGTRLNVYYKPQ